MYLLNEFIFLSPVMVYACFRIRWLIATKILRNVSTLMFILLVAGDSEVLLIDVSLLSDP